MPGTHYKPASPAPAPKSEAPKPSPKKKPKAEKRHLVKALVGHGSMGSGYGSGY